MVTVKQEFKEEQIEESLSFQSDTVRQSSRIAEKRARTVIDSSQNKADLRVRNRDGQEPSERGVKLKTEVGHRNQQCYIDMEQTAKKKSKKEEFQSHLVSLAQGRWQEAGIDPAGFDMDNSLRNVWDSPSGHVSRIRLAKVYGGSFVEPIPIVSMDKYREHGFWGKYLYLGLDLQPLAPQTPGSAGIWFSVGSGQEARFWNYGIMRVFTRIKVRPKCLWQYQGQYEMRPARSIGADEWKDQSVTVRNTWVSLLRVKPWGAMMRARIYARKYLFIDAPTEKKLEAIENAGWDKRITEEEIHYALNRGDERLILYTMKCIGYDYDFQRHVIANATAASDQVDDDDDEEKVKIEPDLGELKVKRKADGLHPSPSSKRLRVKEEVEVHAMLSMC